MKILVVSAAYPFPPHGGGLLRTYHIVRMLAAHHDVTLAAFHHAATPPASPTLPVRVVVIPWSVPDAYRRMQSTDATIAANAKADLSERAEPWFVSWFESSAMEDAIRTIVHDGVDLVLFEGTDMSRFASAVPSHVPTVLDLMDVHTLMAHRALIDAEPDERDKASRELERTRAFESEHARGSRVCLVCSENEAVAARELLGVDNVIVIPNGVDVEHFECDQRDETDGMILFTGVMNYAPNVEGVQYFVREILPSVLAHNPRASFHIVGAQPSAEVVALASDAVVVHGTVPDIRPFLNTACVAVVPLLSGGGTRLKILEAAAAGCPIVSTSLGAEGLAFDDGRSILIADDAHRFAAHVNRLLDDATLRRSIASEARAVATTYDWNRSAATLLSVVEDHD